MMEHAIQECRDRRGVTEQLAKSVSGPVELLIVEDGGHNANNRPYRYRSRTADWLATGGGDVREVYSPAALQTLAATAEGTR